MDFEIAFLVTQDGVASGAIYAMMALGMVLLFNATRVLFVPFGDIATYAALTLGFLQLGRTPGTVYVVTALALLALLIEAGSLMRRKLYNRLPRALMVWFVLPMAPVAFVAAMPNIPTGLLWQILISLALTIPISPLLYRIAFQPIANGSVLVLMTASVALHFAISGLALFYFGPEGLRTKSLVNFDLDIGSVSVSGQLILLLSVAAGLCVALYVLFSRTVTGKALAATAMNREGARLVGIRTGRAGAIAFLIAGVIGAVAGILISPTTTFYYDTGLMIGLKGFVGATFGGFIGYPAAIAGAMLVGLLESFASFYASALKEVIVFLAIIPIVLWRWVAVGHSEVSDEDEEE